MEPRTLGNTEWPGLRRAQLMIVVADFVSILEIETSISIAIGKGLWQSGKSVRNANSTQISRNCVRPWLSCHRLEVLHGAQEYHYRALYKLPRQCDCWNVCYGRMRLREIVFQESFVRILNITTTPNFYTPLYIMSHIAFHFLDVLVCGYITSKYWKYMMKSLVSLMAPSMTFGQLHDKQCL